MGSNTTTEGFPLVYIICFVCAFVLLGFLVFKLYIKVNELYEKFENILNQKNKPITSFSDTTEDIADQKNNYQPPVSNTLKEIIPVYVKDVTNEDTNLSDIEEIDEDKLPEDPGPSNLVIQDE